MNRHQVEAKWRDITDRVKAGWERLLETDAVGFAASDKAALARLRARYGLHTKDAKWCMSDANRDHGTIEDREDDRVSFDG